MQRSSQAPILLAAIILVVGGCGSGTPPLENAGVTPLSEQATPKRTSALAAAIEVPIQEGGSAPDAEPAETSPPGDGRVELPEEWPPETRSLEVRAITHVRESPTERARYIGKITRRTRVAWKRVVLPDEEEEDDANEKRRKKRKRCAAWVEIEPRGYLCKDYLKPSPEVPKGVEQPLVREGRFTPYAYFKVKENDTQVYKTAEDVRVAMVEKELSTKVMVIGYGTVNVDGITFRSTDHGLVDDAALVRLWPSKFEGRKLGTEPSVYWPFAWVYSPRWGARPWIRQAPDSDAERVRRAERRDIVSVLEERDDWVRIADSEWIERKHLRLATKTAPPQGVGDSEQWVDVDLDEQVLVAYEGETPVFATMVSTGRARNETPAAVYRVRAKAATTSMAGDRRAPNRYEVSGVPWAVRFADGLYVHGVYWHDGFGAPRSHGCVNVSARDAHFLYDWIEPRAPDGWSEVEVPGGEGVRIRIRDRENPAPPEHDYTEEEPWNAR